MRGFGGDNPGGNRSVNAPDLAECSSVDLEILISEGNDGGKELFGSSILS